MLMLQRCSEVKENEERERGCGFNKLKTNWETKERNQIPEDEWWGNGGSDIKGGEKGQQIRSRAICFVLYTIGEISVSLEATLGKAEHETEDSKHGNSPDSSCPVCPQWPEAAHKPASGTEVRLKLVLSPFGNPISKPSLDTNCLFQLNHTYAHMALPALGTIPSLPLSWVLLLCCS